MAHLPDRNRIVRPLAVDEGCLRTTDEGRPFDADEPCPLEAAEVIARDAGVIALNGRVDWCTRHRVTSPVVVDGSLEAGWIDRRPIEWAVDAAAGVHDDRLTAST